MDANDVNALGSIHESEWMEGELHHHGCLWVHSKEMTPEGERARTWW